MGHGTFHRPPAGTGNRDRGRETWVTDKLKEVSEKFTPRDREIIEANLRTVKFSTNNGPHTESHPAAPSQQPAFRKLERLLRADEEVPAWLAESVRLLYRDNEFSERLVEKLIDSGYDEEKITDPTLSYQERRPRTFTADHHHHVDQDTFGKSPSDEYLPTSSDADNEASDEAGETSSPSSSQSESGADSEDAATGSSDSLLAGKGATGDAAGSNSNDDSNNVSEHDGYPAVVVNRRRSPRKRQLRFEFAALMKRPRFSSAESSEDDESVKEESGLENSDPPVKEEEEEGDNSPATGTTTLGATATPAVADTGASRSRQDQILEECSSSSMSDDTDPDLVYDDIKPEEQEDGCTLPGSAAQTASADITQVRPLENINPPSLQLDQRAGGRGRASASTSAHASIPPRYSLRRKGRFSVPRRGHQQEQVKDQPGSVVASGGGTDEQVSSPPSVKEEDPMPPNDAKVAEALVISSSSSVNIPMTDKVGNTTTRKNPGSSRKLKKIARKNISDISLSSSSPPPNNNKELEEKEKEKKKKTSKFRILATESAKGTKRSKVSSLIKDLYVKKVEKRIKSRDLNAKITRSKTRSTTGSSSPQADPSGSNEESPRPSVDTHTRKKRGRSLASEMESRLSGDCGDCDSHGHGHGHSGSTSTKETSSSLSRKRTKRSRKY